VSLRQSRGHSRKPPVPQDSSPQFLHTCFEAAARRWPEALAVDVPPGPDRPLRRTTTYAELEAMAQAAISSFVVLGCSRIKDEPGEHPDLTRLLLG